MSLLAGLPIVEQVLGIIDKVMPDTNAKARGELELAKTQLQGILQESADQRDINKVEAAHQSIFVAGWRPMIGWICGLSLATYFIPKHTLAAVFWIQVCWETHSVVPYPIGIDGLMELVFALLGMGALRSVDKKIANK